MTKRVSRYIQHTYPNRKHWHVHFDLIYIIPILSLYIKLKYLRLLTLIAFVLNFFYMELYRIAHCM